MCFVMADRRKAEIAGTSLIDVGRGSVFRQWRMRRIGTAQRRDLS
jgi:hypothetical protein